MVEDAGDAAALLEATDWGSWTSTSWTPPAWITSADDADTTSGSLGAAAASPVPGLQQNASLGGGQPGPQSGPLPVDPVLYAIQLWFMPVLVTLGTLGNCLCVVVFFGTKLKKLSSR